MPERAPRSPEREYNPTIDGEDDGTPTPEAAEAAAEADAAPIERERTEDDAAVEKRARRMGWVPQAEYRGDPSKWRPAQEFLDVAYANSKVFSERFDKVADENEELKRGQVALNARLDEQTQVMGELAKRLQTGADVAYKNARADLENEMKEAVSSADTERYETAKDKLAGLDAPAPIRVPTVKKAAPEADPVVKKWVDDNPWFNENVDAGDFAENKHMRLKKEKPHLTVEQNLAEVRTAVAQRFPELFENPMRSAPGSVRTPSGDRNSGKKGRTYADLPQDAKEACSRMQRTIPGFTVQDYLKTYDWDTP